MKYEKLISLLLGVLIMFAFLLKTGMILECGENLTVFEVFIFKDFQCVTGLDS